MGKKSWIKKLTILMMSLVLLMSAVPAPVHAMANDEAALGQIGLFGGKAPQGWEECNGKSISKMQNQALYSIIGNAFGGDATTFKLPNLSGRSPVTGAKYYMCVQGIYGVDNTTAVIGEVCLLPDAAVNFRGVPSANWKVCDGSTLSSAAYPQLFAVIGNFYGGTTSQFKVPDLKKKTPLSGMHFYIATKGTLILRDGDIPNNYIGSMNLYAFSYVPSGELLCNGAAVSSGTYGALAEVIGTTYGGNSSTFNLPNAPAPMTSPLNKYSITAIGLYPESY